MYKSNSPKTRYLWAQSVCRRSLRWSLAFGAVYAVVAAALPARAEDPSSVIREISQANDRLEMTVNTSRILTLETRIPRLVVTNPDLVTATPVSENQVQIAARKPGVTQINLWDEDGKVYSVDIMIFGDVRELDMMLKRMYPESSIKLVRLSQSLVLEGEVDRPEVVSTIRTLAEDYAPKIVNNMTVGGVQQIMLKVRIMEVSRTKLRKLGFDFDAINGSNYFTSTAAQILQGNQTIEFGIVNGDSSFTGFLEALQQNNLAKTLASPTMVTLSGRVARFHVGGEAFFSIGNGLNGNSIQAEEFGTTVNFVPIVMGNGMIRLEVRPEISEIDNNSRIGGALFTTKNSEVDTGVELAAGQTLAIAGLVQTRVKADHRGLPFISDLPYVGAAFRRVSEEVEEIELLIMVTPEFADGLDPHEVPQCGPGMESVSPSHCELYGKGFIEVPNCGPCGAGVYNYGAGNGNCGPGGCNVNMTGAAYGPGMNQAVPSYGYVQEGAQPTPADVPTMMPESGQPLDPASVNPAYEGLQLEQGVESDGELPDPSASQYRSPWNPKQAASQNQPQNPQYRTAQQPQSAPVQGGRTTSTPGLIGPLGYDVEK